MSIDRRSFLRLGLGGLAGALVASHAGGRARASRPPGVTRPARRCVVLYMHGGASQIDTLDPKPGRPTGGEFRPIEAAISGLRVSEHLPGLAARMDRLTLIRTLTAREGNHDRARTLMHTGYAPQGGVVHASLGAHTARAVARAGASEDPAALPSFVSIGAASGGAGYLGARWAPFVIANPSRPVRNLAPPESAGLEPDRFDRRVELWRAVEDQFTRDRGADEVVDARAIAERAVSLARSPRLAAFDLSQESAATRARYGDGAFADGCLLARRLLEAGVDFVEVGQRGWDTHEDNFARVRQLSGELDRAAAALIDDLVASGLWADTLLVWLGDFGRTPRINARGGRDHFPEISAVLLGGGPIPAGAVIGETDADGEAIRERPVTVPDLFATLAEALGVDPGETHATPAGRPVTTVDPSGRSLLG